MDGKHKRQLERILQSVRSHGPTLVQNILDEHGQNPHMMFLDGAQLFQSATICRRRDVHGDDQGHARRTDNFQERLNSFIARKADLIFALEGKDRLRRGVDYGTVETSEAYDTFANTPPLEKFLGVDATLKREQLFMTLKPGDIVTGKVVYKRPFGIFIKLINMEQTSRDFSDLETLALCRTNEMPNSREFLDPSDAYSVDDVVRGVVISTNANEDQILVSFRPFHLPPQFSNIQLGLLEEGEQSGREWSFTEGKTYNKHLNSLAGFSNPRNVETLSDILGVNAMIPCSLLRSAQRSFPDSECYEEIRKKQTSKWSMETTAKGVELFKSGNTENALKCFKHALEIDPGNVEALVAKGALNANQDRLNAAVQDFHDALAINPHHRNANKYLAETLIAQANEFEEERDTQRAAECYKEILERHSVSEAGRIAAEKLQRIREEMAAKEKLAESKVKSNEGVKRQPSTSSEKGQFNHVRQLIKKEKLLAKKVKKKQRRKKRQKSKSKHRKKERKRHKSSSESSSSSSDSESETEQTKESVWVEKTATDSQSGSNVAPQQEKPGEHFDQSVGISQVLLWYESSHRNAPKKVTLGPLNRQDSKDNEQKDNPSKEIEKNRGKGQTGRDKTGKSQRQKEKKHLGRKRKREECSSTDTSSSESSEQEMVARKKKKNIKQHRFVDKYVSSSDTESSSSGTRNGKSESGKRRHSSSKDGTVDKHGQNCKESRNLSPPDSDSAEKHSREKEHHFSRGGRKNNKGHEERSTGRRKRSLSYGSDNE